MVTPILWGEFRVNTITDGEQTDVQLTALSSGMFLATWVDSSQSGDDSEGTAIYAQVFYSGAVPKGAPVLVNTTTAGIQGQPTVTTLADGRIVIAWESHVEGGPYEIRARIFNVDGTAYDGNGDQLGDDDFQVASGDAPLGMPSVAGLSDGGFVISYTSDEADEGPGIRNPGIVAVAFDSQGVAYTGAHAINSTNTGVQTGSHTIGLDNGKFLVLYRTETNDPANPVLVHARVFTSDGASITDGTEITFPANIKAGTDPAAAILADGRLILAWTEDNGDEAGFGVKAQIFSIDGTPDGNAFVINKNTFGDQTTPAITALKKGGFAVSYLDWNQTNLPQVRVAVFDKDHKRLGTEDKVISSAYADGVRSNPGLIELSDGRLIAAWDESVPGRSDDSDGIRGQVIDARTEGITEPGTAGNDQYVGTHLGDTLSGAGGDDHLNGVEGNDRLDGGIGRDTLNGGTGADVMIGGAGDDTYYVDDAGDALFEYAGGGIDSVNTTISYALSAEVENLIANGTAALSLTGNAGANTITGNAAANIIDGGAGADIMSGGLGNDVYYVDNAGDQVVESFNDAADQVFTTISYALAANVEHLTAAGSASISLTGNELANVITGNAGKNVLNGWIGDDRLDGGSGNDRLHGGLGRDTLNGGTGKDIFVFDTKPNKKTDLDTIVKFNVKDDGIWLENKIFKKLGKKGSEKKPAKLNKKFFSLDKAKDKDDYLIYNKKKGVLSYDADGSGSKKAIEIAKLDKKLKMTYKDFFVI